MMKKNQKTTFADRLNIGNEVRELKLGRTFNPKNKTTAFHTIKYDFKPAGVDVNKVAGVDIAPSNEVTVTVPNLESSTVPHTVYKGNQKNYTRECVIIIDKKTGQMTLELLNQNIQVKKTRTDVASKTPKSPPTLEHSTMRRYTKTKVSTGGRRNNQQPQGLSPLTTTLNHKSPQSAPEWNVKNARATLPSIPMIVDIEENDAGTTLKSVGKCVQSKKLVDIDIFQHQPQQGPEKQPKSRRSDKPPHQQQNHHNPQHQQQQQQELQKQEQQIRQQSPSQQRNDSNQNKQIYENNSSSNNFNLNGMSDIGSSTSNNCKLDSSSSNTGADEMSSQILASSAAALEQEIDVSNLSDSSSGESSSSESNSSDSSSSESSDSDSDSDDNNENNPQENSGPPEKQESPKHQSPDPEAAIQTPQQQSSDNDFQNILVDDLQLSSSDDDDY